MLILEKFRYHLRPPERERAFLESRVEADKLKMKRLYFLALCIIPTFLVVGLLIRPPSYELTILTAFRGLGILVVLAGLLVLRKSEDRKIFEWTSLACLFWLVFQVGIVQLLTLASGETVLAWNVFLVFLLYLAVPISLRYRLFCAISLSVMSIMIWLYKDAGSQDPANSIGLVSVYLAINIFGMICASAAARTEREEFLHLEAERQLKAELELTLARLEESVESRNLIYQVLAHDLRNVIGALETSGQLLVERENYSEKEQEELIDQICESSKSSHELLDRLLLWALSESESSDPNLEATSLNHAVTSCVSFLSALTHEKKIQIDVDIDASISVWADSRILETVIRNLAANAIKFTHSKGTVQINARAGDQGFIVLSITDDGVGIDQVRLSRIFSLQHDESTSGTGGERGTNLGLRICQRFVEKMGGQIWASSEVEKGSQFSFSVPTVDHFTCAGSPSAPEPN